MNVADEPAHTSFVKGATTQTGLGLTISLAWQVFVQPSASATINVYNPALTNRAFAMVSVQFVVSRPGPSQRHLYGGVPPEGVAVNVAGNPMQTSFVAGVTVHTGFGLTINRAWHVPVHPSTFVTVTMYTPASLVSVSVIVIV